MNGKSVLITWGTKWLGFASGLKFGEAGARAYLTFRWGKDDYSYLYDAFEKIGAPRPVLVQADVSVDDDTEKLLSRISETENKIDFFISNVGVAQHVQSLRDYRKRSLFKTLEYSTWPLIDYTRKIKEVFGSYPEYILGISSDGPDHFYQGYDYVGASKALLEFFAKYLSVHLFEEGTRVNVIRFGPVKTESFSLVFGKEFFDYVRENDIPEEMQMTPNDCGNAVFALCSGFLSAMNGQIITVDKGMSFRNNLMMSYLKSRKTTRENRQKRK